MACRVAVIARLGEYANSTGFATPDRRMGTPPEGPIRERFSAKLTEEGNFDRDYG
jgi:hypothetical protein